jgi:hypothetical protein
MPSSGLDVREYVAVYGCVRALTTAVVAVTVAVRDSSGPSAPRRGVDQGCRRRSKTKYEIGRTLAELTTATTAADTRFRPRNWLAGRPLMSIKRRHPQAPSAVATAAAMSSLWVRLLGLLHRRLGMTADHASCIQSARQ